MAPNLASSFASHWSVCGKVNANKFGFVHDAVPFKAVTTKAMYKWKQTEGKCGIEKMLEAQHENITLMWRKAEVKQA